MIGAGPAGLSAAAELARAGRCLLLEQGGEHTARGRADPVDLLSGVGGAGLFSDGKHSFFPSASALWTLPDAPLFALAFAHTAALLGRHGVEAGPWAAQAPARPPPGAWHFKPYPSRYMPLDRRMALIAELAGACERWTGARVLAASRDGPWIRLGVAQDGVIRELQTRALIVATGRLSPLWIRPWLAALGVGFGFRRLEFGVRVEAGAGSPLFTRLQGVDPKLCFVETDRAIELRTFCTCRDGEVVRGEADGIVAYSGRADGPPSGRSNLGLLVRVCDEALARTIAPALFAASPGRFPLAAADLASLTPMFGDAGAAAVLRGLERLYEWCPELRTQADATLYAPCIEGVGEYPLTDGGLQAAPGVWLAGDLCGRFRGIVAGMVSGRYAALRALAATSGSVGGGWS